MDTWVFLCALIVAALGGLIQWLRRGKIEGIPEPDGNYILGNVFQLGGNLSDTFLEWKKTLGPVFQIRLAYTRVVVFNDKESISKACAMPHTAGRGRFGFFERAAELFGAGLLNGEGPIWEEQRQFYQKSFRTFGVGRVATERSLQDEIEEKLQEWEKLDGAPFQLRDCNMTYVFNATWAVLGSHRMEANAVTKLAHQISGLPKLDTIGHRLASSSGYLAEKFSNAMKEKLEGIRALTAVISELIVTHQTDRVPGEPRDVIDNILDKVDVTNHENSMFHKKYIKSGFALFEIMFASMDTTSKTLEWLMLYLTQKPEAASKLYAEIDRVLGEDLDFRPGLSERDKMPYVQACILEALRMSSVAPIAVPHKALEDFEFNGALIPKGTILLMNLYGVHYDPEVWDQPQEFRPERFLTPEGDKIDMNVKNKIVPFGIGRRMCPGNLIALDTIFLFVANVYRKFRFELVDEPGGLKKGKFGFIRYTPKGARMRAIRRGNI